MRRVFSSLQVFSLLIFIAGGQSDRVYNKTRARQLRSKRLSESRRGVSREEKKMIVIVFVIG